MSLATGGGQLAVEGVLLPCPRLGNVIGDEPAWPIGNQITAADRNADRGSTRGTLRPCRFPKRSSVDDFFAQLDDVQRPHLEALRALSLDADPEAREELKWNLPASASRC